MKFRNVALGLRMALFLVAGCGDSKGTPLPPIPAPAFQPVPNSKPCGPAGSYVSTLIPEFWTGFCATRVQRVQFTNSCVFHDSCYGTLGSAKESCDTQFHDQLREQCGLVYKEANCDASLKACLLIAKSYFDQVAKNGQQSYEKSQAAAKSKVGMFSLN